VKICNTTLRDGKQQAGIIFSKDVQIRIAEKLASLGGHRLVPAMPVVSPEDESATKEILKRNLGCEVFADCQSIVVDVKQAADCGVKVVVIGFPVNQDLVKYALGWEEERGAELAIQACLAAKELGMYTVLFGMDSTRAEPNWCVNILGRVAKEAHVDAVAVAGTMGDSPRTELAILSEKLRKGSTYPSRFISTIILAWLWLTRWQVFSAVLKSYTLQLLELLRGEAIVVWPN
jgi:isopropylmalate/homocitrate/citramalate synthase